MLRKLKRRCRLTTLMLVLGFAISMTAVLIGISVIHDLLESLSSAGQEAPILQTMQNSGLSLALRIYLFSMVNCMTAANFWVITRRRDLAVCKAFGWSGARIIGAVVGELAGILLISLGLGLLLTAGLSHLTSGVLPPFSWEAPCCSCSLPWRSPRQSRLSAFWESIRRR